MTDANLLLGRLDAGSPLAGGVDAGPRRGGAGRGVAGRASWISTPVEAALGIVRVANSEMAAAVRVVTVERGIDPRDLALVAFGGAGPLHAAEIADELEMRRVIVPNTGGVLSALGLVLSEHRRDVVESVLLGGAELTQESLARRARPADRARPRRAGRAGRAELRVTYELRYAGQAFELPVEAPPDASVTALRRAFDQAHETRYGYRDEDAELELVTVRVTAATPGPEPRPSAAAAAPTSAARAAS